MYGISSKEGFVKFLRKYNFLGDVPSHDPWVRCSTEIVDEGRKLNLEKRHKFEAALKRDVEFIAQWKMQHKW